MATYVQNSLIPGEEVIETAKVSVLIFVRPVVWFLLGVLFLIILPDFMAFGGFFIFVAVVSIIKAILIRATTELAVTNKRVLAKFGIIKRGTIELGLERVESARLSQGVVGRICNFGNLQFTGFGSSSVPIPYIDNPLKFKKKVMESVDKATHSKSAANA